jgi:hypothetical protein
MGEVHVVIDDEVIESGDFYAIIEPVWESVDIYEGEKIYREGLKKWSEAQQYVFAVWWYQYEVNNGGHEQFFENSAGIVWEEALKGLKEMGLEENVQILKEAIERMGGAPSKEREGRFEQLESLEPNFDDLDERFDKLMVGMVTYDGLEAYIKANRESFYFDGMVNRNE